MNMNKKGISAIVATVLIILITVAAVTIIWAAIIPMINEQLSGATECLDASAALSVSGDYSCYNNSANYTRIQVVRGSGAFGLLGIDVIGGYEGNTDIVKVNGSVPGVNGARVYTINVNSSRTNSSEFSLDGIDSASVAAWVKSGQTEKLCTASMPIDIRACD